MITSALKFCRGGVSDQLHSRLGGVVCPLHYSAVRDDWCGSREGRIHSHLLHFRPSCQERGGKDLIAALSDDLKIDHVEMQLFPGVSDQGVLEPPGFLNRMVARLRRAPRWRFTFPAISGSDAEIGPSLCRLRLHDLSRPRPSKAPGNALASWCQRMRGKLLLPCPVRR